MNEEAEDGRAAAKLMPVLIERVKPPLGLRGIQATDLIDWDGSPDAAPIRQLISDITVMMQASGSPKTQPASISESALASHKIALPLRIAKPGLPRLVSVGALLMAAAALALVLRQQSPPPVDTKPPPRAAAMVIPTPVPTPAAVEPAAVKQQSSVVKTAPTESEPVLTQKREPPIAPVAKRGGRSKVDQSRCEAIVQRAQLGTPLGEEDKAFLKRDC